MNTKRGAQILTLLAVLAVLVFVATAVFPRKWETFDLSMMTPEGVSVVCAAGSTDPTCGTRDVAFGEVTSDVDTANRVQANSIQLGNKYILAANGDGQGFNDGWLRMLGTGKEGGGPANDYYGGLAVRDFWTEGNITQLGDMTHFQNGWHVIAADGRMHIQAGEVLYLLPKDGVIIGREWGGNGNLIVEGDATVSGKLCVGSTCISESDLQRLLAK